MHWQMLYYQAVPEARPHSGQAGQAEIYLIGIAALLAGKMEDSLSTLNPLLQALLYFPFPTASVTFSGHDQKRDKT